MILIAHGRKSQGCRRCVSARHGASGRGGAGRTGRTAAACPVAVVSDRTGPAVRSAALRQWRGTSRGRARVQEPDPAALLARLQAMEARAGRVRGERNAARTLDLDIIAMGDAGQMVRAAPDPVLPHPRAHLRAFVLLPLLDVAPGWVHPVLRRSLRRTFCGDLPCQDVRPIAGRTSVRCAVSRRVQR